MQALLGGSGGSADPGPLLAPGPLVLQSLCLDDMGPWPWLLQNWHLQRAPRRQLHGAILPSGTCLSRNTVLLHREFGEAPASSSDRYHAIGDTGAKVFWTAPEGIELKIKQADVLEFSEINKHFGGPLGGIETFFCGGDSTAWFLQGKASFCYALQKVDNDIQVSWVRGSFNRRSDSQPFQVLDVYPMAHGVSLTGIGTFGWHSMLTVEIITQK